MTESHETKKYPLRCVYFYLTEGCNLKCRHCWITPKHQKDGQSHPALSIDLFRSIIEQAKSLGLSSVKLTGGEPLLHPHILQIIEMIRDQGLRLGMETNGTLCTLDIARELASCKGASISVSLDGATADTHEWMRGTKGCYEAAVDGLRNLAKAGLRPQIIMSITRSNVDQMEAIVRLAESLNAGSVKFNIVQPVGRGEQMHKSEETLSIEQLVELGRWVEQDLSSTTDLRIVYGSPIAFRSLGKMFGAKRDGCGNLCGILRIIGVLADGSYALCGIGEIVPEFIFGHASTDPLEDVWRHNPTLMEIREGLPHRLEGICSSCVIKNVCLGCCIAQNYYYAKRLWAPNWYCDAAQKSGIFPATRISPAHSHKYRKEAKAG